MRIIFFLFMLLSVGVLPAHAQLLTGYEAAAVDSSVPDIAIPPSNIQSDVTIYNLDTGQAQAVETAAQSSEPQQEPVDIEADNLSYDEQGRSVRAQGDVFIAQEGRILRADDVLYNLGADEVEAKGHVVLNEANGDIHYAERAQYNTRLQNG